MFAFRRALLAGASAGALALSLGLATAANATTTVTDTSFQVSYLTGTCPTPPAALAVSETGGGKVTFTIPPSDPDSIALDNAAVASIGVAAVDSASTNTALIVKHTADSPFSGRIVVDDKYAPGCVVADYVEVTNGTAGFAFPVATTLATQDILKVNEISVVDGVQFLDASTLAAAHATFSFDLPAGVVQDATGLLTVAGSTADPGTYVSQGVTLADSYGASTMSAFTFVVNGSVTTIGPRGDEVNRFGNGFDVFRQNFHAGAIIAGWTATQADPATDFIRENTATPGTFRFEAVNGRTGIATGLCVSDPGGGWASDPLPDGLILTPCNTGPFQEFAQAADGTLKNAATHLVVNPNGTGSQLRGGTAPTPWGGSFYTWTDESSLP